MIFSKFHRRFPYFTIQLHHGLRHWPWMALVGIALPKCTWHAATSAGQNSSSITSRKKMEVKRRSPHGKQDFFQLLAHARALGHGATSGIWQIISWQSQPHPRIQLSNTVVLKDVPCQVSRLNPTMHVDVTVSQACLRIRHLYDEFNTMFTVSFCLSLLGRRSKSIPRFPSLLPNLAHTWFAMKLTSELLNDKAKQHQANKSLIWLWFWNPIWNKKSCKLQSSPQHKIKWHNGLALNAMLLSEATKWFQQGFPACQSCSVLPPLLPL